MAGASPPRRDVRAVLMLRWPVLLGTFVACAAITMALAFLWPATYRASATILVEQQEIPPEIVRSTVTAFADQRLRIIEQRVMTTTTLLELMNEYDLYRAERSREPRERLLERVRSDISMNVISAEVTDPRSGRPTQATIAFELAFESRSPQTAYAVANRLVTLYRQENRRVRSESVENTAAFLAEEAEKLRVRLERKEARLADFKSGNITDLPEMLRLNLDLLNRTQRDLAALDRSLRAVRERRAFLEAALAADGTGDAATLSLLERLRAELRKARAIYDDGHPDVVRLRRQVESLERVATPEAAVAVDPALADVEERLASARARYADRHPDVIALEQERADLLAANPARPPAPAAAPPATTGTGARAQASLVAQLEATKVEELGLQEEYAALTARLAQYEVRLAQTPEVERQYRTLTRDIEAERLKYQEITNKLIEARLAQSLESRQRAERFTVLEFPLPPQRPVSPNRPAWLFFGLVLSAGLAILVTSAIENGDRTVRGPQAMASVLGFSPLAYVPVILPEAERRRRRRLLTIVASAGGVLLLVLAAALVHWTIKPLDVLFFLVRGKLGL